MSDTLADALGAAQVNPYGDIFIQCELPGCGSTYLVPDPTAGGSMRLRCMRCDTYYPLGESQESKLRIRRHHEVDDRKEADHKNETQEELIAKRKRRRRRR